MTSKQFLNNIEKLVELDQSREASKVIFKHFNKLLADEYFDEANDILLQVQPHLLDLDTALSFVTITFSAKGYLPNRDDLCDSVKERIAELTSDDKAESILERLR